MFRRRLLLLLLAPVVVCTTMLPPALAAADPTPPTSPNPPVCGDFAPLKADGTPWACSFDDEFNGTRLDTTKWSPITTAANGVTSGTYGCFVDDPANIAVADGALNLTVRNDAAPTLCKVGKRSSFVTTATAGQVSSYAKFAQTYGRFSIRAKFPAAAAGGVHSALWLWPDNPYLSGLLGEIDLAEVYSVLNDRAIPYLHYLLDKSTVDLSTNTNVFTNNYCMINDVTAFHEYTLEWTPSTITIMYDAQTCLVDHVQALGLSPFNQPYSLDLTESLGVRANAPTPATLLPATLQIDWVRVWQ